MSATKFTDEIAEALLEYIGDDVDEDGYLLSGRQIIETLNGQARKWGLSNPRQVSHLLKRMKRKGLLNYEEVQTRRGKQFRILPTVSSA